MALTTSRLTINFLQQPLTGASFSYRITNNGIPLTYTSGVDLLYKEFKSSQQSLSRCIAAVDNNFNVEPSLDFMTGFNGDVFTIATQSTGKIIVGGSFTSYNGSSVPRLCRLNSDGSLDTTFTNVGFNGIIRKVIVNQLVSDTIYVLGDFTNIIQAGKNYNRLIRLNSDGTINTGFTPVVFNNTLNDMHLHTNGAIYIIGSFTTVNGTSRNRIISVSSSGSVNTTSFGTGFNNVNFQPYCITQQSTGNILIGGDFSNYNGNTVGNIVRITSTGAFDATFTQGTGFTGGGGVYSVRSLYVDSGDKIYASGRFNTYNGTSSRGLIRLGINGVRDATFNVGTGFGTGEQGYSIKESSDGKIVVGGVIESYNGTSVSKLIKLNTDGTLNFTPTISFNAGIRAVICLSNKIIVGGSFTVLNNTGVVSSQYLIPISATAGLAGTFNNSLSNLNTFNINSDITYSSTFGTTGSIYVDYEHDTGDVIIIDSVSDIPNYVEIVLPVLVSEPAKFIMSLSPFMNVATAGTYSIDTSLLKMKIWKGHFIYDLPLTFNYAWNKQIVLTGQSTIPFNVSNFIREYNVCDIDNYMEPAGTYSINPISNDTATWAQLDTTTFYGGVTASEQTDKYLSIDGYGWGYEGFNPKPPKVFLTEDKHDILRGGQSRFHFITNGLLSIHIKEPDLTLSYPLIYDEPNTFLNTEYIMSILIPDNGKEWIEYIIEYGDETIVKRFYYIDECLYSPIEVIFKNKYGLLQSIPMSKKSKTSYKNDSKDYERSLVQFDGSYNVRKHNKVKYNLNGVKNYTLNTHYVKEYYNESLKELVYSEEVYLNINGFIEPVILTDDNWEPKTNVNDKLIQYTMKFEVAQSSINKFI